MEQQKDDQNALQMWRKLLSAIGVQRLLTVFALVSITFVVSFIAALVHPAAGEAFMYNVVIITGLINVAFVAVVLLMVISSGVTLTALIVGASVKQARTMFVAPSQNLLPSGMDNKDIIICERVGEDSDEWANRVLDARAALSPGYFFAVIRHGYSYVHFVVNGKDITKDKKDVVDGYEFSAVESEADYVQFCEKASNAIAEIFASQRNKSSELSALDIMTISRPILLLVFAGLLLIPSLLFSQPKSERVKISLPEIAMKPVTDGTQVQFNFESGDITRTGDGSTLLADLIGKGRAGADADNMGAVKSVTVGQTTFEAKPVQSVTVQKLFNDAPGSAPMSAIPLPDSVKVIDALNEAATALPIYKTKAFAFFRPIIGFFFYLTVFLLPLLAGALALLNFVSRSAAQNGNLGQGVAKKQVQFAAWAWYLSVGIAGLFFIFFVLWVFFAEWHPAFALLGILIGTLVSIWFVNATTPNGQYRGQQRTTTTTTNNNRGLGSGF